MSAETALRRALAAGFTDAMVTPTFGTFQTRPWASVTFTGVRFALEMRLSGVGIDELMSGLGEREFDLPGYILIDIAATEIEAAGAQRRFAVEALVVEAD